MGSCLPRADTAPFTRQQKNKEYEQERSALPLCFTKKYHYRTARQCPYADIVPSVGTKGRNGKAGGQHRNQ